MIMMVRVKVYADAGKETFTKQSDSEFEISVREPPLNNMANRRVCSLLAAHFGVDVRSVRIEAGHRSPRKTISIAIK